MEQWGTGYERIVADCNKVGHPVPVWEEIGEAIRVTFRPHPETIAVAAAGASTLQPLQGEARGEVAAPAGTKPGLSRDQVKLIDLAREPRAIGELMAVSGRTNRTKFRDSVLSPLLEAGLLAMTTPDKPTSSKQRYVATAKGRAALNDAPSSRES